MTDKAPFKSEIKSILTICEKANMFVIPGYQREFSWDKKVIKDLIQSIYERISRIEDGNNKKAYCFLGSVILACNEEYKPITAYDIVDGQQRLTVFSLIAVASTYLLYEQYIDLNINSFSNKEEKHFFKVNLERVIKKLKLCFSYKSNDNVFSKIVRKDLFDKEKKKEDIIDPTKARNTEYNSDIASFLHEFTVFFDKNIVGLDFNVKEVFEGKNENPFQKVFDYIKEYLKETMNKEMHFVLKIDKYIENYDNLIDGTIPHSIFNNSSSFLYLKLIFFINYFLNYVVLSEIKCEDEDEAFLIFEPLNTTGYLLTAIEILKANISGMLNDASIDLENEKYFKYYFAQIEEYISEKIKKEENNKQACKETISQDIVMYFLQMRKEGTVKKLIEQRSALNKIKDSTMSIDDKKVFIKDLSLICDFMKNYWEDVEIDKLSKDEAIASASRVCMCFLRDMGQTLTIPIFTKARKLYSSDEEFYSFINAFTAFTVLRRSYTGDTQGIDKDFKSMLAFDDDIFKNLEQFKQKLREFLKKVVTNDDIDFKEIKEIWLKKACKQGLYKSSKPLVRFLLFIASEYHKFSKEDGIEHEDRNLQGYKYLNFNNWNAPFYKTIEHICPQKLEKKEKKEIADFGYQDIHAFDLLHTIGNLTLIPQSLNSSVKTSSWQEKKKYFKICSIHNTTKFNKELKKLYSKGLQHSTAIILENNYLPFLEELIVYERWNYETVEARSQKILNAAWNNLIRWL